MKSGSWELSHQSAISIMRGEQGAAAHRPPSNKVASPTTPSQQDLQDRPLDLTPGEGLGIRQTHLDLAPHLMEAS